MDLPEVLKLLLPEPRPEPKPPEPFSNSFPSSLLQIDQGFLNMNIWEKDTAAQQMTTEEA